MCSLDHSSVIVLCAVSVQCQWIHVTSTLCAPPPPQHSHMNQEHVSGGWKMSFLWHRLKGGSSSDARFAFSLMRCILEQWNVGIRLLQPSSRPLWWACSCYKLEGVRHVCTEARYIINAMHGTSKIKDSCAKKKGRGKLSLTGHWFEVCLCTCVKENVYVSVVYSGMGGVSMCGGGGGLPRRLSVVFVWIFLSSFFHIMQTQLHLIIDNCWGC